MYTVSVANDTREHNQYCRLFFFRSFHQPTLKNVFAYLPSDAETHTNIAMSYLRENR